MWENLTKVGGVTNSVILPSTGVVSIVKPEGVELCAYVNGVEAPLHHLHVNAGDSVHFELKGHNHVPSTVEIMYDGKTEILNVVPTVDYQSIINETPQDEEIIKEEIMTPAETINLFANPGMGGMGGAGAGAGAGLGAGLLGGVLGGALLGGRGVLGGVGPVGDVGGVVTPALLASTAAQITDTAQSTVVLQTLGDIKASIPLAEGQVQLALAGAQADINRGLGNNALANAAGQAVIVKAVSDAIATGLAGQGEIKTQIANQGAVQLAATNAVGTQVLNAQYQLTSQVRDDGDKTRALIIAQNDANLQRMLTVAENALLEQRAIGRSRDVEVNVTQTVSQNQAQIQAQAQQQQQFLITNNLLQAILSQAQVAQATNQSLIIGNTGAVVGGPQNANPTNVRA